jgi:hypothetical protein
MVQYSILFAWLEVTHSHAVRALLKSMGTCPRPHLRLSEITLSIGFVSQLLLTLHLDRLDDAAPDVLSSPDPPPGGTPRSPLLPPIPAASTTSTSRPSAKASRPREEDEDEDTDDEK